MSRVLALAIICGLALTTGTEASHRRRAASPVKQASPTQPVQDEYKSCDVAVRDFVQGRKEATALPVKEVKVDGLRMTLNFIHSYGESGDTPPNLSFTRGESVEERRKALNEAKQRINALAEAAKTGNVWYVIALRKDNLDSSDARRSPSSLQGDDSRSAASAVVLANIENRCITVSEFQNIPSDRINGELRKLLGEKDREASPADSSAARPQS